MTDRELSLLPAQQVSGPDHCSSLWNWLSEFSSSGLLFPRAEKADLEWFQMWCSFLTQLFSFHAKLIKEKKKRNPKSGGRLSLCLDWCTEGPIMTLRSTTPFRHKFSYPVKPFGCHLPTPTPQQTHLWSTPTAFEVCFKIIFFSYK
jgi:hypothetical protein